MNITCKGDVEYDTPMPRGASVETSSKQIPVGTQVDGKSGGKNVCGTFVAICIYMLRML